MAGTLKYGKDILFVIKNNTKKRQALILSLMEKRA